MAESSQYAIQLKAVLDTTDVQNKLAQLRMAQNQINSQGGGRGGAGGNLGNLGNTLQKLNTSIVGLQKSIDVLGRNFRGQTTLNNGRMQSFASGSTGGWRGGMFGTGGAVFQKSTSLGMDLRKELQRIGARYQPYVDHYHQVLKDLDWLEGPEGEKVRGTYTQAGQKLLDERVQREEASAEETLRRVRAERAETIERTAKSYQQRLLQQEKARQYNANQETWGRQGWNRAALGFVGGQLLGGLGEALWDPKGGFSRRNKTSIYTSALGQGVTQAGAGTALGSMFGPWGMAAGAVLGFGKGLFEEISGGTSKMKEVEKAQRDLREALKNRSDFGAQQTRSSLLFTRELQSARKFRDIPYAREMERSYAARAERAQLDFLGMQTPGEYLKGLLGDRSLDNETIQKRLQAYQQEYDNAQKLMQITQQQADATKSLADEMQRFKEQTEAVARAFNNAMGARNLAAIDNAREFGVDRILQDQVRRQEVFANGVLHSDDLVPREKFTQLTEALDQARRSRNQYLNQAYALNRDAQLGNHSAAEREDIIRRRDWAMRQAGVQGDMASILENALKEIQVQNWRPNLQNLTSLSQFGFGMGEKDDGVDIMERYWERQLTLTREIRDKLDEGPKSEAVYQ